LIAVLLIEVVNLVGMHRLGRFPVPVELPAVAVLLPARNEARNIEACVRSLLAQRYPSFRVMVVDDESSDGTGDLLARMAAEDPRLEVIAGSPPPPGWTGKNWACHRLATGAHEPFLLFVDADTRHHPLMLRDAMAATLGSGADLLSGAPRQVAHTWAERLTVPMVSWVMFALIPHPIVARSRWTALSAAIGQFMLFRRSAYEQVGGHAAVRDSVVEDLALGRAVKREGRSLDFCDLTARVECRMYQGRREVWEGFGRTIFAFFNYNLPLFAFAWLWLALVFIGPPLVLWLGLLGYGTSPDAVALPVVATGLGALVWVIPCLRLRLPGACSILYPVVSLLFVLIAARSALAHYLGRPVAWKGRAVPGAPAVQKSAGRGVDRG
jgi:chlorobactene glucosyltransferase